jgi:hypothetical protein
MLEMACSSGSCGGSCPRVGLTTEVLDATNEAPNRGNASLVKMYKVGLLKTLSLYRELVDIEIRRASEHGARWWSRRLVEMSEEVGLVRLDQ